MSVSHMGLASGSIVAGLGPVRVGRGQHELWPFGEPTPDTVSLRGVLSYQGQIPEQGCLYSSCLCPSFSSSPRIQVCTQLPGWDHPHWDLGPSGFALHRTRLKIPCYRNWHKTQPLEWRRSYTHFLWSQADNLSSF